MPTSMTLLWQQKLLSYIRLYILKHMRSKYPENVPQKRFKEQKEEADGKTERER